VIKITGLKQGIEVIQHLQIKTALRSLFFLRQAAKRSLSSFFESMMEDKVLPDVSLYFGSGAPARQVNLKAKVQVKCALGSGISKPTHTIVFQ
jgi:hypothetical protein